MKTLLKVICILLSAVCGVLCQLDPKCAPEKIEICTQDLRSLYSSQDGPVIVKNEAELSELCRHQQSTLSCITKFVDNCMPEPHKNIFNNLTIGVQDFVNDFCTDTNTRRVYIKHLSCFNQQDNLVHHCTDQLHEWNKRVEKTEAPREQIMRQACCRYDVAMSCLRTVVKNGCPREASDLFDGMIDKVTKQFFQFANCVQYNYVHSECSGALSSLSPSLYSVFFGSVLAVLFSMFRKLW